MNTLRLIAILHLVACSPPLEPPPRLDFDCADDDVELQLNLHDKIFTGAPVEGALVCIVSHPDVPCEESDALGRVGFCAPPNAELAVTYEKESFMPTIVGIVTTTAAPAHWREYNLRLSRTVDICDTPWTQLGEECPPTTRALMFIKAVEDDVDAEELPPSIGDVSVTLDPPAEIGPVFDTDTGVVDDTRTSTNGNGNAFAAGLTPGDEQRVRLSHPFRQTCRGHLIGSWPDEDGVVRVPVREGYRTFATVTCR